MSYEVFDSSVATLFYEVVKGYIDKGFDTAFPIFMVIVGVAVSIKIILMIVG